MEPIITLHRVIVPDFGLYEFRMPCQFPDISDVYTVEGFMFLYTGTPCISLSYKEIYSKLCLKWARLNERPIYTKLPFGNFTRQDDIPEYQKAEEAAYTVETLINIYVKYVQNPACALFKLVGHPINYMDGGYQHYTTNPIR